MTSKLLISSLFKLVAGSELSYINTFLIVFREIRRFPAEKRKFW